MIKKQKVLNAGSIELIDIMGDEQSIVDAARVSIAGENVKPISSNVALIRYLLRHKHTSPFEMVEFKFRVKCPIFIARQWMRHRTWSFNEVSARYSELPDETWNPSEAGAYAYKWRKQSKTNKQCSDGEEIYDGQYEEALWRTRESYEDLLLGGVAREQARAVLPVATYTTFIAKVDLHNLLHFIKLRNHPHAQKEIRDYAAVIATWVAAKFPNVWDAFYDYEVSSIILTGTELRYINSQNKTDFLWPTKREKTEWEAKSVKLAGVLQEK